MRVWGSGADDNDDDNKRCGKGFIFLLCIIYTHSSFRDRSCVREDLCSHYFDATTASASATASLRCVGKGCT